MKTEEILTHSEKELGGKSQRNVRILELLRRKGPISRTDISKASGINPVTVSQYVDKLIDLDFVYEKSYDVSSGGRRPLLLDINPKAAYTIGIGVNLFGCHGVLVDLDGQVVRRAGRLVSVKDPGIFLEQVVAIIDELLQGDSAIRKKLKGIGVGLGGIIDEERELVRWPSAAGDQSYASVSMPLKKFLTQRYETPVLLANDADMACFAEHWFSFDQSIRNIVYMYSGVSCGLLLNGELYRGKNGCVGELFVNHCADSKTSMGDVGFLHAWHHDLGLLARANALLVASGSSQRVNTIDDVFSLDADGVLSILDDAAHALGVKIAFLVNILNPDAVVIGGGFERGGRLFIEAVESYVRRYAFDEMTKSLQIVPTGIGDNGVALGAAAMMAKNVFASA